MRAQRLAAVLLACAALGACAIEPTQSPPAVVGVTAHTSAPRLPKAARIAPARVHHEPFWASLTASFALHDCADSRLVHANERMYTRSPAGFEQRLQQSLPLLMYVQQHLQAAGLPGEFAMLPMLESSYNPSESRNLKGAAGMWQLIPGTARRHGVEITRHYDGRLNPIASTRAAIAMLKSLDAQFGDWRLVTMAYHSGPGAVAKLLREHPDPGDTAIPDLPASAATRTHLARLLALSCIVREPARFHVELPKPTASDRLAIVKVPAGTHLKAAASAADLSDAKLRALNAGYRGKSIPADSPRTLLLPAKAARTLAVALATNQSDLIAQADASGADANDRGAGPALPLQPPPPPQFAPGPIDPAIVARHRVHSGESLWSIAHHFGVTVRDLQHWNHLHSDTVHPGQVLRVHG